MKNIILLSFLIFPYLLFSQQLADTTYNPTIINPMYDLGKGPVVFVDEGHHNFHTKNERFRAFSNLLERDGYNVKGYAGVFEANELEKGKILVISNALNERNVSEWVLPNPSAFTLEEIDVVREWVTNGGNLFLIADHMPMAGAAQELAKAFGFEFTNGFAVDTLSNGPAFFNLAEKSLDQNVITQGRNNSESVKQVASFTGQAFRIPEDATPILTFGPSFVNMLPDTAWVFNDNTTTYKVDGWLQGAFKRQGRGKVVVFGEAAMFTAQLVGPRNYKAGMNNDVAPENYQLLLNIIHWLDGQLE